MLLLVVVVRLSVCHAELQRKEGSPAVVELMRHCQLNQGTCSVQRVNVNERGKHQMSTMGCEVVMAVIWLVVLVVITIAPSNDAQLSP